MTNNTSTQTYFLVGLLAALVLVPVLALAATTSPGTEQGSANTTHDTSQPGAIRQ